MKTANITIDAKMLCQLIESADVRADQLDGKDPEYYGETDHKAASHIRLCIQHIGGAIGYDISEKSIDLTPPDALDR